ncbi:ABC-2 type transport system permease protein [Thermoactinomyces sp. DSM 45891]|uniref:ABC transporter permease n=1 Tax=Thermoactinomyces sp. DSM 45891 TaxID=1761907 RepID=UPI000924348C|nr:ABC transporter permease [Thermoactinomyces sp. DSM 45891]SFX56945.1 ABC-2 type transport system permease protein [Thermoactinomyces sp. DSM 45891]
MFFKLIHNENIKTSYRLSTWIMMGLLVVAVLLTTFIGGYKQPADGQADLQKGIEKNTAILNDKEADEDAKEMAQKEIAKSEYLLANHIKPYTIHTYLDNGQGMIVFFGAFFGIIIAANSVASEFSTGTIKLLLIRPIHRFKILLSKYVSALFSTASLLLLGILLFLVVGGLLLGFEGITASHAVMQGDHLVKETFLYTWSKSFLLSLILPFFVITFTFMISTVFRNNGLAIGLSMAAYFGGNIATLFMLKYKWVKFTPFIHMDYLSSGDALIKGMTTSSSSIVLGAYFLLFLAIAMITFKKRDIAI